MMTPVTALSLIVVSWLACSCVRTEHAGVEPVTLSIAEVLGAEVRGFAVADRVREFRFPQDHGAHPEFRTEWWYVTGNLETPDERRFGFQFTIFRTALEPDSGAVKLGSNGWTTRQLHMGHFALTDVGAGCFHSAERFSRAGAGLAGAQLEPFRVWLEDWSLESQMESGSSIFPLRLRARDGDVELDLTLEAEKPLVLQGDDGLSRKSAEPGNASYYYAYTRLSASGSVRTRDGAFMVDGLAWFDREWSTSALAEDQVGWDWFALQLDDGTELMLYQIRLAAGGVSPESDGSFIEAGGERTRLATGEFTIEVEDSWTSPHSGVRYPSRWRLSVPERDLVLDVTPVLEDQELEAAWRYWEGAVDVSGPEGLPLGRGYVELVGYE